MVKRRSFEDGLSADLTAKEAAFMKQGRAAPRSKPQKPKSPKKSQPEKEESYMSKPALKRQVFEESPPAEIAIAPVASPLKVSNLSVRIDSRIAAALLRAMTERKITATAPWVQQEIVTEALLDWLKKHGFSR